ncbi:GNAT family N-acetyltransferase [Sphingomonas sp. EC-HK361]|jgi:GNAT superfamily N-acetyltransferase|uniref:GNAT family N-acetyltransferase n=1 Tax=Sphingomonas sp. EC-HK361 TaxID=2038397 RepID=UPI00125A8B4F|nr:GNAT family N-acetyltransferase [Sphingomonas sp. EC-HK361]VVT12989.1 GNAT family N-acetyltransferase [Sphingomonas sp. EC-HK361]
MSRPAIRIATTADIPEIRELMRRAIDTLQRDFLGETQIAASRQVMGLDTQLIEDGTYFVAELGGVIAGCGGWSRRATLYGGDHSAELRDATLLDPAQDAARIRTMFTHPDFTRRGVGAVILRACESAAFAAGFERAEMMATLAGEPLYRAAGYVVIERTAAAPVEGVVVPLVRMGKLL